MTAPIGKTAQPPLHYLILLGLSLAVIGAAAAISSNRYLSLGVVAAVLALGVGLVAVTRFELFTLFMIGARTAVDITHTTGDAGLLRLSVLITGLYTIAALVWLLAKRAHGRLRISVVTGWAGIFTIAALTSAAFSPDGLQALVGASRWVFLTVFVLTLENLVVDERAAKRLLVAVGISTLVPLLMGAMQFLGADPVTTGELPRIEGSFSHPNTFAFYLVVVGLVLISIVRHLGPWMRLATSGLLIVILISLLATYSRTSYVAFLVGLGVLILIGRRGALLALAGLALGSSLLFPGVVDRIGEVGAATTVRGTAGDSLTWRVDYWQDIISVGEGQRVTGLGLGVAGDLTAQGREPHNDFVRAYVEVGWIGLLAYLGLMVALGKRVVRSLAVTKPHIGTFARSLAEGFTAIFAAYLVASVTGNLMTQLILLWYVLAIGVSATLPHEKGRRISPQPKMEVSRA